MTRNHRLFRRGTALLGAGALTLGGLAGCSSDTGTLAPTSIAATTAPAATAPTPATADTTAAATTAAATTARPTATAGALSADEVAGLVWMREEEQLAHDVYDALGDLWGVRIFDNISASESTHLEAVAGLLDRYGIADPSAGNAPGTFTEPRLQALYDQLMVAGRASLAGALEVGALIEETDIVDLRARAATTQATDILAVYANLEKGSRNHLRAFTSQLGAQGTTYVPTVLDADGYAAIVAGPTERGPDA